MKLWYVKCKRRGRWDFRFCGFGQFLVRFFGFHTLIKLRYFGFGVLHGLRVFSGLVFGFRFLSTMMAVFRISLSNAFYGFSGFAKEVTPCSRAKIAFPRDHLYSVLPFLLEEKWMTSLVRLASRVTWNKSEGETVCLVVKWGLPLCLRKWKFWQWQLTISFGMWCFF